MIPKSVHKRPRPHFPLNRLLRARGRSQYSLACQLKLSPTYLNRVALGKVSPGWKIVCLIADALAPAWGSSPLLEVIQNDFQTHFHPVNVRRSHAMDEAAKLDLLIEQQRLQEVSAVLLAGVLSSNRCPNLAEHLDGLRPHWTHRRLLCRNVVSLAKDLCFVLDEEADTFELTTDQAQAPTRPASSADAKAVAGWTPPA